MRNMRAVWIGLVAVGAMGCTEDLSGGFTPLSIDLHEFDGQLGGRALGVADIETAGAVQFGDSSVSFSAGQWASEEPYLDIHLSVPEALEQDPYAVLEPACETEGQNGECLSEIVVDVLYCVNGECDGHEVAHDQMQLALRDDGALRSGTLALDGPEGPIFLAFDYARALE